MRWLIDLAKRAGVSRLILNGSFVTDIIEPNDVDCSLLISRGYPKDKNAAEELREGLPFLDISILPQAEFEQLVSEIFAMDRYGVPKGVVEVML
ncbi:MAG: SDR family oxidoreductase [Phycisphaerales bacterium]|nr:SDR family oxidoreductase [Phycisphaerales bacterium]